MNKKIYLASPFFNDNELTVYRSVIGQLRSAGYSVYVPQEHSVDDAWDLSNADWAQAVFTADMQAIHDCDYVMILNFGMYSDSGTAWEAGYAMAARKMTIQVLCGGDNATYSLMMINGCDKVVSLQDVARWEEMSAAIDYSKIIQK